MKLSNNKSKNNPIFLDLIRNQEVRIIHKFGRNGDVGTTHEDIWNVGGLYNWQTSAQTLECLSANIQDGITGFGCRKVKLQGLDSNCNEIEEIVDLIGGTVSLPTTKSFLRLNRAFVYEVGTYHGSNYDDVIIRVSGGGDSLGRLTGDTGATPGNSEYGIGQTQLSMYSVPAGWDAYISHINLNVDTQTSKTADIVCFQYQNIDSGTYTGRRLVWQSDAVQGSAEVQFDSPVKIPEKSDIWFHSKASASSAVDINYDIFLVKR
jgi:hypothetical protein